ncbi:MAG: hypothetical protein R2827_02245 [Bdellovibrionales bacterium]
MSALFPKVPIDDFAYLCGPLFYYSGSVFYYRWLVLLGSLEKEKIVILNSRLKIQAHD